MMNRREVILKALDAYYPADTGERFGVVVARGIDNALSEWEQSRVPTDTQIVNEALNVAPGVYRTRTRGGQIVHGVLLSVEQHEALRAALHVGLPAGPLEAVREVVARQA